MNCVPSTDTFLLPALDRREEEGGGVNWKCVTKLINFVQDANCLTDDLRYSLKSRLKSSDPRCVLNTLTVYYTIALNGTKTVRDQLSGKRMMDRFQKLFLKSRDRVVRYAILQLLMDWSFLFGNEILGKRCATVLRELNGRHGFALRPTSTAADLYSVLNAEQRTTAFLKGVEFECRENQIAAHEEHSTPKVGISCASNLTSGSLKLGSMKRLFGCSSSRTLKKHADSAILRAFASREQADTNHVSEILERVPRDCKNLRDLLSDVHVLMYRGHFDDIQSKMSVAEELRNKCATINNTLQEMITTRMKRVTSENPSGENEEIKPALMTSILQAGDALKSVLKEFEQTHIDYIRHLSGLEVGRRQDEEQLSYESAHSVSSPSNSSDTDNGASNWVEFTSTTTDQCQSPPAKGKLKQTRATERPCVYVTTTSSSGTSPPARQNPCQRPRSSTGHRLPLPKCPIPVASEDRNPPPLPIQSPFADASALLEATHPKQTSVPHTSQRTRGSSDSPSRPLHRSSERNDTPSTIPCVESTSRSFSELTDTSRRFSRQSNRPSMCPALKVRFTDAHLEAVLSRLSGDLN